jgi:hypothetical protein
MYAFVAFKLTIVELAIVVVVKVDVALTPSVPVTDNVYPGASVPNPALPPITTKALF